MDKVMTIIMWFFLGAIAVLIFTHPKGFATVAGSVFTGVNTLGTTLTGAGIKGGG